MSWPVPLLMTRPSVMRSLAVGVVTSVLTPRRALAGVPVKRLRVYKDATCSCCDQWAEHVRDAGWGVTMVTEPSFAAMQYRKDTLGVPAAVRSCHTGVLDIMPTRGGAARQYVVEGRVPAAALERLILERPNVAGLAVPAMPSGTPGMELGPGVPDAPPFTVQAFDVDGTTRVFGEYAALRLAAPGGR